MCIADCVFYQVLEVIFTMSCWIRIIIVYWVPKYLGRPFREFEVSQLFQWLMPSSPRLLLIHGRNHLHLIYHERPALSCSIFGKIRVVQKLVLLSMAWRVFLTENTSIISVFKVINCEEIYVQGYERYCISNVLVSDYSVNIRVGWHLTTFTQVWNICTWTAI